MGRFDSLGSRVVVFGRVLSWFTHVASCARYNVLPTYGKLTSFFETARLADTNNTKIVNDLCFSI